MKFNEVILNKVTLEPAQGEEAKRIEFMFNPNELKFSRSVNIEQAQGSISSSGDNKTSFKGPNPYQLTISNIMLDTYENKDGERSVLKPLKPFTDAMAYAKDGKGKAKRPPVYLLTWGTNVYLRCFIKSCNFRLTMFLPDGTPVRAIVDLTLEQADDKISKPTQGTPKISLAYRNKYGRVALNDQEDQTTLFQ